MVKVRIGNILESNAQTLVNTVNCVGVMGKGIALEFKQRFPDMYKDYLERCNAGHVKLGRPYLYRRLMPPWILNFPTKDHWRSVARLEDIVRGLEYIETHYREWGITSLAVPPLGCGQGQLEWSVVGPTLYRHLRRLGIPVELYAPYGTPKEELENTFLSQPPEVTEFAGAAFMGRIRRIEPGLIAVVAILSRIEKEPYHWPVGRTTFQKIAYFATEKSLPTGLRYSRGSFGPHATEFKAKITQLANNGLIREERLGQMFAIKVGPTFEDARLAPAYRPDLEKAQPIIEEIADLFLRMRTRQAEVAATIYFVAKSLTKAGGEKPSENQVLLEVTKWKQRRRPPLTETEVAKTIRNLAALGWLDVKSSPDPPFDFDEEAELDLLPA